VEVDRTDRVIEDWSLTGFNVASYRQTADCGQIVASLDRKLIRTLEVPPPFSMSYQKYRFNLNPKALM
jgi:hypothetical protein